jgi:hypothetical protein
MPNWFARKKSYDQRLHGLGPTAKRPSSSLPTNQDLAIARNPGSATAVGATPTKIAGLNRERSYLLISNDSSNVVYLALSKSVSAIGNGIHLAPAGNFWCGRLTDFDYDGEVWAIASASSNVGAIEV